MVTVTKPRSPGAEAYRTLRTNIHFAAAARPLRSLLCVSAGPGEGKSTAVANLAVVMAQAGTKVVVLDGDLRRPSQHAIFNLRNAPGLTNLFLSAAETPGADLPLQSTAVANLRLLASGPRPPNPVELLASGRMEEILGRVVEHADIVLIDSPPLVPFADAAVLSAKADGVVLVVGAGTVKRDLVRKAKAQLEAANARVLGVAVVNVAFDATSFGPYYEGDAPPSGSPPA